VPGRAAAAAAAGEPGRPPAGDPGRDPPGGANATIAVELLLWSCAVAASAGVRGGGESERDRSCVTSVSAGVAPPPPAEARTAADASSASVCAWLTAVRNAWCAASRYLCAVMRRSVRSLFTHSARWQKRTPPRERADERRKPAPATT
jgi:hypothetical protein